MKSLFSNAEKIRVAYILPGSTKAEREGPARLMSEHYMPALEKDHWVSYITGKNSSFILQTPFPISDS